MKGRASGCAAPHNWEEGGAPCFVIFTSHHPIRHSRWEGGEGRAVGEQQSGGARGAGANAHTHTHISNKTKSTHT